MLKGRIGIVVAFLLVVVSALNLQAANQSQASAEQTLWKLEHAYWNYVQDNDLSAYRNLWHKDFLGWPSVSAEPVHKDHITDWITTQTSKGLAFKTVEFRPAAIQVDGLVAVTYYWITYQWRDKDGKGEPHTIRVTHTWIKDAKDWHIIGGMSMPQDQNPPK